MRQPLEPSRCSPGSWGGHANRTRVERTSRYKALPLLGLHSLAVPLPLPDNSSLVGGAYKVCSNSNSQLCCQSLRHLDKTCSTISIGFGPAGFRVLLHCSSISRKLLFWKLCRLWHVDRGGDGADGERRARRSPCRRGIPVMNYPCLVWMEQVERSGSLYPRKTFPSVW